MKIALCLSGQPRFVKEISPYIIQNLSNTKDKYVFVFDFEISQMPKE